MTLEELLQLLAEHPLISAGVLGLPPLLSLSLGCLHSRRQGGEAPWKYGYMLLVYAACIPGIFSGILTAYLLLFRNENVLKLNVIIYFLPMVAMLATLLLIRRQVNSFNEVPGFGRLSGLMVMLGLSFALGFALHRMHFGILFCGSLGQLVIIALTAFAVLKWAAGKFGGDEPRKLQDVLEQSRSE